MTKAEWRTTCRRVADERGRFVAEQQSPATFPRLTRNPDSVEGQLLGRETFVIALGKAPGRAVLGPRKVGAAGSPFQVRGLPRGARVPGPLMAHHEAWWRYAGMVEVPFTKRT